MFDEPLDSPRQHHAFDVAPDRRHHLRRHRMINPFHILLDNRSFIEHASHEMRGGADQFDAAFMRLGVRFGALEAR